MTGQKPAPAASTHAEPPPCNPPAQPLTPTDPTSTPPPQAETATGLAPRLRADRPTAEHAFDQLVLQHTDRLHRLAYRLLGWADADAAQDIVQDVLMGLWSRRRRLRATHNDASLAAYLNTAIVRRCKTRSLRHARRRRRETEAARPESAPPTTPAPHAAERRDALHAALQRLKPADRAVLVLHYLEGWTIDAIAESLSLSRNACDQRLTRARRRLRQELPDDP